MPTAGITGYIVSDDPFSFANILRRNEDIDAMLRGAGIDPESVNVAHTPMIGASNWGCIRVLVTARNTLLYQLLNRDTVPADAWQLHLVEPGGVPSQSVNSDPAPANAPATPEIKIINNPGIPLPVRDVAQASQPENAITVQDNATNAPSATFASAKRTATTTEIPLALRTAAAPVVPAKPIAGFADARSMDYYGLVLTSVRQLRRSAGVNNEIRVSGMPLDARDDSLFVIDFVDARYRLQGLRSLAYVKDLGDGWPYSNGPITDSDDVKYTGGMTRSRFNMLSETPVAFEAQTVKKTLTYPPALLDFPGFANAACDADRAPSWNHFMKNNRTARHWTNTAAAATHFQQPYSRDELLSMFAKNVELAAGMSSLTLDLSFYHSQLASSDGGIVFDDGDVFNLDFTGMTLGEALDVFAQRLGCVWLYDKSVPSLVLSLARKSLVPGQTNLPMSVPDLGFFMTEMEDYRQAGYINTVTLSVPQTVFVSHATHYCSRLGPERSGDLDYSWYGVYGPTEGELQQFIFTFAHLVDSRSHTTNDGVISTKFVTGLNADGPGLWHANSPFVNHTIVEIRDHIPALVGHNTPSGYVPMWLPGTNWMLETDGDFLLAPEYQFPESKTTRGIGVLNTRADESIVPDNEVPDWETPWNYTSPTLRTSYRDLDLSTVASSPSEEGQLLQPTSLVRFDTTLKKRREILQSRIEELRKIVDGDATYTRMPPKIMYDSERQITPSVGLQYETVHFGAPDIPTVRYRLSGTNTHPLLYPYGAKMQTTTGGFGVSTAMTSGVKHFSVRKPHHGNVLRVFMARIIGKQSISAIPENNPTDAQPFSITKYVFVEATPDANPFTMYWSSSDALGYKGLTSGIAFNLYEQWFNPVDDGVVRMPPTSVGGTSFVQSFGENDDQDIIMPKIPAVNIVPVYEVANRLGFSSYWIAIQPDLEKRCAPNPPGGMPAPTPPTWPYMGASGAATSTSGDLADIIENA